MKGSLKFRNEQKPLLRAKVPLNILGMPFQSGIVAGDSKELTLNLATFFESGPSLKLAYRPNDSRNPFSLILKTGTGPFGSPLSSSMLMSCEFNLLARHVSPIFTLHFKPRFGDFSFKKSQSSILDNKKGCGSRNGVPGSDDGVSTGVLDSPIMGSFSGEKVPILGSDSHVAGAIENLFSGMEVAARTTLPVRERAEVKCRWGVRVPAELKSGAKTIAFQKVPFLVLDKIGVELVDGSDSKKKKGKANAVAGAGSDLGFPANADVAEACLTVKTQLEVLQGENVLLRNAMEDLRREIGGGGGSEFGKYREFERNGRKLSGGKSSDGRKNEKKSDFNAFGAKSTEVNASEELKKKLNPSK